MGVSFPKDTQRDPRGNNFESWFRTATRLARSNENDRAKDAYRHCLNCPLPSKAACLDTAIALERLGDTEGSLMAYERAAEAYPQCSETHAHHGVALLRSRRREEALAAFDRFAQFSSDPSKAHFQLGSMLIKYGEFKAAARHLQILVDLDNAHIKGRRLLADVSRKLGHTHTAIGLLRSLIDEEQSTAADWIAFGASLSEAGQHEEAAEVLAVLAEQHEDNWDVIYSLGRSKHALGQVEEALLLLRRAITIDSSRPEGHYELGLVLFELGRRVSFESMGALEEACRLKPDSSKALCDLGRVSLAAGQRERAIQAFGQASALEPDNPDIIALLEDATSLAEAPETVTTKEITSSEVDQQVKDSADFSGNLDALGIPDLLEFLCNGRRYGRLSIHGSDQSATLVVGQGDIVAASTSACPRLGDILVAQDSISRATLEEAVSAKPVSSGSYLGTNLLQRGLVSSEALRKALLEQVLAGLGEVLKWKGASFSYECLPPEKVDLSISLETRFTLMELMRRLDEGLA